MVSPDGKVIGSVVEVVMAAVLDPLKSRRGIGGIGVTGMKYCETTEWSMKQ